MSAGPDDPAAGVLAAAAALVDAFGRHDADTYFARFAPDASFVFYNHPERLGSRAAYQEVWAQWERDHGFHVHSCESRDGTVQLIGASGAVFIHDVVTEVSFDGERETNRERETIVFGRDEAGWIAVHEHLSPADAI